MYESQTCVNEAFENCHIPVQSYCVNRREYSIRKRRVQQWGTIQIMLSSPITTILAHQPFLVLDGAMATELERRGCDLRDPLWSAKVLIEQPELIQAVHADYFAAGADCAITASYQASFAGFAGRGIDAAGAAALMQRSVQLACAARDAFWAEPANRVGRVRPFVAASVGPYGAYLADGSEYRGDYGLSVAELIAFHRPRMAELARGGAELFACETIPCLDEARALAALLPEFPTLSAWISFSARDGEHICHGERLADCVRELTPNPQIVALGVNCTAPSHIPSLIAQARSASATPIVVYPNSGEVYDATTNAWSGTASCEDFATQAKIWYNAGARLIGGCCRTGPEHIREIREIENRE
jgi:homocysteine S-methyltransferase